MNVIRKTVVALVVLATMCSTKLSAQEFVNFQSTETGICVTVPEDMNIVKHDETILHLQSDLVSLSVHPMLTENLTAEAMTEGLRKTAAAAGFNLGEMDVDQFDHKTLEMVLYGAKNSDGLVFGVGVIQPKENEKVAFMITLTYVDGAGDVAAGNIISSLEFNPDVIE